MSQSKLKTLEEINTHMTFCLFDTYQEIIYIGMYCLINNMQKNTSVILGEHFEAFISAQIDSGRFGSASEAIRAGLRLLEEHEMKVSALQRALTEGENSEFAEYSLNELLKELDKEQAV